MTSEKQCFPKRQGSSCELTMIMTPCTRLEYAQAKQNPHMEGGSRPDIPLLAGELLTLKSCY